MKTDALQVCILPAGIHIHHIHHILYNRYEWHSRDRDRYRSHNRGRDRDRNLCHNRNRNRVRDRNHIRDHVRDIYYGFYFWMRVAYDGVTPLSLKDKVLKC